MAIEAGVSIVIVGEHPDNGKFYTIGEVRQDGWIVTTDNHLFHQQFFEVYSPLEPRPKASKTPKRAKCSTTPNSFLGESESPIFLGENLGQNDHTSEISPKKKTVNPVTSSEIFLGENLGQNDRISEISPKKKTVNPVTSSEIFLGENLGDHTSEISPKKKTVNPVTSSEIFLGENDRHQSSKLISPKKNPSGSLYAFNQEKKDKHGNVKTYPKVEGARSTGNPDHWFWAYCWDEKVNGRWKTFKRSVPREKLSKVRMAIDANQPVSEILKIIG
ncbi:hypothetical protein [Microcystis aeruginosa]|uniref:C-5 cytosine-specific DNA methylase n=1 Tax=Microcystis aeruginosa NIES-3787 TaxID=2517782 RepID=A0A6H9GAY6_MICAE|nr:hypothetical protein [Microcystis aeruginosa]GCL46944.1 C-5 cytosine-specific DNA methylase [Microcystis aeruginosa NIES-3787]